MAQDLTGANKEFSLTSAGDPQIFRVAQLPVSTEETTRSQTRAVI